MSIKIIWSLENGGSPLSIPLAHGDNANQNILDPQTIFIRHTGENPITNCKFYIRPWSGSTLDGENYSGDATPTDDYNELIQWGDDTTTSGFGGFQINMDAAGGFPDSSWPDKDNKVVGGGLGFVASSGVATDESTGMELKGEMSGGSAPDGEIPPGNSPNYRFQARFQVPQNVTTAGIRLVEQVLSFTFTS